MMTSLKSDWLSIAVPCVLVVATMFRQSSSQITCPSDERENTGSKREVSVTWQTTPRDAQCTPSSGSVFPIGVSSVVCLVQDMTGNEVTCRFLVTVTDNHAPEYTKCPEASRRVITNFDPLLPIPSVSISWDKTAGMDNSGSFDESSTHDEENSKFPLGVTTVEYTASDNSGNIKKCTFAVSVAVQPPNNHTFTEDIGPNGFTVAWPELDNNDGFYTLIWKNNDDKPDVSKRVVWDSQGATYRKGTFDNLSPGELYNVEISHEEDDDVISTIQQWTEPNPPQNLLVEPVTPSSLRLSWSGGTGEDKVEVYMVEVYRFNWNDLYEMRYVSKEMTSVIVGNLHPGYSYRCVVEAQVGSGDKRTTTRTTLSPAYPAPLNNSQLIVYNYTESTIDVAWRHMFPSNTHELEPYMVFIISAEDMEQPYQIVPVESRESIQTAHFEGLKPNTNYKITVISNLGLWLQVTQTTRPRRVRNIRASDVQSDSITLTWEPPTDDGAESYCYEVYQLPQGSPEPISIPKGMGTSFTFTSLTNGTEYYFDIFSKTNCPDGLRSVRQSLMVIAGLEGAVPSSPTTKNVVIIGAILGVSVLLLAIILMVTCVKYQRAKVHRERPNVGQNNRAMNDEELAVQSQPTANKLRQIDVNEAELYEVPNAEPGESSSPNPTSPHYQNAPPNVQKKPKVTRR